MVIVVSCGWEMLKVQHVDLGTLLSASSNGDGERKSSLLDSKDEGHQDIVGGCDVIILGYGTAFPTVLVPSSIDHPLG